MTFIAEQPKVLFFHIQKTGGMTVRRLLKRYFPGSHSQFGRHSHAPVALEKIGKAFYGYYRFTFVRNPWDRMVSWFSMVDQTSEHWQRFYRRKFNMAGPCDFATFIRLGNKILTCPQIDYIRDRHGNLLVNDVYRFEHFTDEIGRRTATLTNIDHTRNTIPRNYVR
jgi:hypothetical protein